MDHRGRIASKAVANARATCPSPLGAALGVMLLLAGCAGPSVIVETVPPEGRFDPVLAAHTAGHAGCPHTEIEIVDYHVVRTTADRLLGEPPLAETWTARCRGTTLFCSVFNGNVTCRPEVDAAVDAAARPPPVATVEPGASTCP